jgi:hypothetical protein
MNMQTAPGKFCSASFFSIALLWPMSCATSDLIPAQSDLSENHGAPLRDATSQAFAKLIDRELAASFPHLRPHQGQIVLGQNQLQVVASSVPPLSGGSIFYPVLSALYSRTGKTWQQQTWLPPLEISISTPSGEALALIGQDLETHSDSPRLISFFRAQNPAWGTARLDMEWLDGGPMIKVSLTQEGGAEGLRWKLRVPSGYGEEHTIPWDQDRVAGLTISFFPEVFTLLSQSPLTVKSDARQTLLTPAPSAALNSTFVLLPGREAALQQAALVAQLKQCTRECWKQPARAEAWQIQLPLRRSLQKSDKRLFQSLFVHDDKGGFVSTLPIFEGEQLKWNLPLDQNWEVLYPDTQGILQKLEFDKGTRSAKLPALTLGSVQIDLKPGRPGFVEIRDAVRKNSVTWARHLAHRPYELVNAHSFLQKNWPLQAQLPGGDYQLQIRDGMQRLCVQRFTVLPGRHQVITCSGEDPKPELSLRAHLSLDSGTSEEMLQAAQFQAIGHLVRPGREASHGVSEIPMLMAEDPNLGLSLRAFPADESMRKNWLAVKPKDQAALLPAFAKFAQAQEPPLQLVLECPDSGFQFEDYRWLALTIEPDFMEVLGCQQPDLVEPLLQVAHKLQQKTTHPVKFAAATPFRGFDQDSDFIPALYVPEPANLIAALRSGNYSLGLRSEIAVAGPLPSLGNEQTQTLQLQIRSYDLKDQPGLIRIYDQFGLLAEQKINAMRDPEQKLPIAVRLRPSSRFLRLELLGQGTPAGQEDGLTQPFLLATSNFLSLNGPP